MKTIFRGRCFLCGSISDFRIQADATLYREATCSVCGASKRNSDVALALLERCCGMTDTCLKDVRATLADLHIYEPSCSGVLHDHLKSISGFVCSEYLDDCAPGSEREGIRCEDLTELTFSDDSFDIVITQDVLEHVADPWRAFSEIQRVLKPGGFHVFTVPLHEGRPTTPRAILENGLVRSLSEPVYHGDPVRPEGSLVFTDFGDDLPALLRQRDWEVEVIDFARWHGPGEITSVGTDDEIIAFRQAYERRDLFSFFQYNSQVFVARNIKPVYSGERYLPGVAGPIVYEHWHRYFLAADLVKDKTVIDIACGEGYGSNYLAKYAKHVIGIDVDPDVVERANRKYGKTNLRFICASASSLPVDELAGVEAVVSFETIEHIDESGQHNFLKNVKQILAPEGVFIVSTPEQDSYAPVTDGGNEYHVKEFSRGEFAIFLNRHFSHVALLGQKVLTASYVWPLESRAGRYTQYSISSIREIMQSELEVEPVFVIAVCSNASSVPIEASLLVDTTNHVDFERERYIRSLREHAEMLQKQVERLEQYPMLKFILKRIKSYANRCLA